MLNWQSGFRLFHTSLKIIAGRFGSAVVCCADTTPLIAQR